MNSSRSYPKIGYLIVTLGALFYCYEYFLRIAPSVMSHELMRDFGLNATLFGTLSACYYYAYTPMQLVVGVIVDYFSIRRTMVFAILACAIGSLMMVTTHSFYVAAAGRFLQGFGSAFAFVGTLKLASIWLPAERFGFFSGLSATLGFLGGAVGVVSLNLIVSAHGWRPTLLVFVLLGFVLAAAVWVATHIKATAPGRLTDKRKLKDNLRDLLSIIKLPRVWFTGIISYLMFLPTTVFADLWGVSYLQKLHHYSSTQASIATSMIYIGWALGSPLMGYISDTLHNRINCMRVGALSACILSVVLLFIPGVPFYLVCFLFLLFGTLSAAQALTFPFAKDLSPISSAGTAIAFVNMLAMMGGLIFQRGVGELLDMSWSGSLLNGIRVYSLSDYQHALLIIPVSLGLAFIITLLMRDSLKP